VPSPATFTFEAPCIGNGALLCLPLAEDPLFRRRKSLRFVDGSSDHRSPPPPSLRPPPMPPLMPPPLLAIAPTVDGVVDMSVVVVVLGAVVAVAVVAAGSRLRARKGLCEPRVDRCEARARVARSLPSFFRCNNRRVTSDSSRPLSPTCGCGGPSMYVYVSVDERKTSS
jgi:hypothetical protein